MAGGREGRRGKKGREREGRGGEGTRGGEGRGGEGRGGEGRERGRIFYAYEKIMGGDGERGRELG